MPPAGPVSSETVGQSSADRLAAVSGGPTITDVCTTLLDVPLVVSDPLVVVPLDVPLPETVSLERPAFVAGANEAVAEGLSRLLAGH